MHQSTFLRPDTKGIRLKQPVFWLKALNCEMGARCTTVKAASLIASGSHPDVQVLAPDGRSLRLDQIRELCRQAGNTPLVGRTIQYNIVLEAEKLLPEAAKPSAKDFGGTAFRHGVYSLCRAPADHATKRIVSRCQEVWFTSVDTQNSSPASTKKKDVIRRQAHLACLPGSRRLGNSQSLG